MAYEIHDADLWSGADTATDEQFAETFRQAMEAPELIDLLIFEEDGEPVGFANLMTIFSVWSHGKAMILDDLFIDVKARGKGYGTLAMQYIEDFARDKGFKRLQFQSELTNPSARKFYEAMGYMPSDMCFYVKYFQEENK